MTTPFAFPDIETALVGALADLLSGRGDTAAVATRVPNPRPPRLVRLVRVGGARRNLAVDQPRIVLECWDDAGDLEAATLGRAVRALVTSMAPGPIGDAWCDVVHDRGFAFSPDPDTGTARYLVTVELLVGGSML